MHAKERVIAPLFDRFLGLHVEVIAGLNTDIFGTFSRDIARAGSQVDAARAKILAAMDLMPDADMLLASEGSFGPHPHVPFFAFGRELVVLRERETGLEIIGHHATLVTNFAHAIIDDVTSARAFADRIGFPGHGIIVMGCIDGQPAHSHAMFKDIYDWDDLVAAIALATADSGAAFLETDMRAHRNPTRMRAIRRATIDLIRRVRTPCPECRQPGFSITERLPGLPCSWCSNPTSITRAEVLSCAGCGWRVEQVTASTAAEPGQCDQCNP